MKKTLLGLIVGMFIGIAVTLAMPAYAAVKQYILTGILYPVVVNGTEYKDAESPILNLNGSTYIPLAKIGDLTGVEYHWNDTLKQVEIETGAATPAPPPTVGSGEKTSCNVAGQKGATLCPDTPIEIPEEPGYKGYPDSKDPSYQMAIAMARDANDYPPLMSEGWISVAMLDEIEGIYYGGTGPNPNEVKFSNKSMTNPKVYMTLQLPDEFVSAKAGDLTINDMRIKKYYGNTFFNIADLQKAGIISN